MWGIQIIRKPEKKTTLDSENVSKPSSNVENSKMN